MDKGLVKLAQNIEGKVPNYDALRFTFTRRHIGVGMHMAWCRKIYSSFLRQNGIESEIVDLLSGRVPKTVFARHYFTPSLDYRDKVMNALNKLKEQIEKKEE